MIPLTPFWDTLTKLQRQELTRHSASVQYAQGQYLLKEGIPDRAFFILKSGVVKCLKYAHDGRLVTIKLIWPGDPFCSELIPGSIIAMTEAVVLKLPRRNLPTVMRTAKGLAMQLVYFNSNHLRDTQAMVAVQVHALAKSRLAALLRFIAQRAVQAKLATPVPNGEHGLRLNVPITRQELADLSGLSLPMISKLMNTFKRDHLVTETENRLVILDLQRLQASAEAA